MSDNNEYYAVNFKIQQKSFFSIWISAQNGDMFLKKNNQLGRMSSLYIFINIVYSLPKKLKYADNQGFQRAQVLWSCPRKVGQGRKTAGGGRVNGI